MGELEVGLGVMMVRALYVLPNVHVSLHIYTGPCAGCIHTGRSKMQTRAYTQGLTNIEVGQWGFANCVDGKQARQRTLK